MDALPLFYLFIAVVGATLMVHLAINVLLDYPKRTVAWSFAGFLAGGAAYLLLHSVSASLFWPALLLLFLLNESVPWFLWIFARAIRTDDRPRVGWRWTPLAVVLALDLWVFFVVWVQIVPMAGQLTLFYLGLLMVRNAMGHSDHELYSRRWLKSPFRWITTVTHHDLHHDRFHHNYALHFTWWDRWMGTEHPDYHAEFYKAVRSEVGTEAVAG